MRVKLEPLARCLGYEDNKGQVPHKGHEDLALTMTETWASVNTAMRRERGEPWRGTGNHEMLLNLEGTSGYLRICLGTKVDFRIKVTE